MKRTIITAILTLALTAFAIQAVEQTAFKGAGIIESTTGGFKFPDGSIQSSAVTESPGSVGLVDGPHHRFVSTTGNDANPCTSSLPCRSFTAGIAAATAHGKVVALDSGDYGPFTVTKSLTIEAAPGVHAGVAVFSGAGVTVNTAAPEDIVILKGLVIHSSGGEDGINAFYGQVHIHKCTVSGFNAGGGDGSQAIHALKEVLIEDSILIDNHRGVWADGDGALVTLNRTRIETNSSIGVFASCGARVVVRDSVVSNNLVGVLAECGVPTVLIDNTHIARNFDGVVSNDNGSDNSVIWLTGSSVLNNIGTGLKQVGASSILSRGDNTVEGNGTNTSGSIGAYSAK